MSENEEETLEQSKRKGKIPAHEVRNSHIEEGAILIEFEYPYEEDDKEAIKNWRSVEQYGFKVTLDGCLISHPCRWFVSKPNIVNYNASLKFFKNEDMKNYLKYKGKTDEDGWPITRQYSHLCHYQGCCSPYHVVIEKQWQNLKRNFCGKKEECDCGNDKKCIRKYHNSDYKWEFEYLNYDTPKLKEKIQSLFPDHDFKILQRDHYKVEDQKKINRSNRNKKSKN